MRKVEDGRDEYRKLVLHLKEAVERIEPLAYTRDLLCRLPRRPRRRVSWRCGGRHGEVLTADGVAVGLSAVNSMVLAPRWRASMAPIIARLA